MIRLTNEQWERIRNHFPEEHIPDGRAGRKPIPTRCVFEAVLWILNIGAQNLRLVIRLTAKIEWIDRQKLPPHCSKKQ
jgi:hypothetical protein